ncbi:MAG: ABC transporter ATP-binding protein [FCB group bacterium]|nr:ABC transporter ATP-binding protein [FCB group bacterium]
MVEEEKILLAKDVYREFKTANVVLPVLRGINLEIKRREMTAITGASGVGKSTLLHILGGLDRPTKGEVFVDGISLNEQSEKSLAKFRNKKIGFIFQFHYLMEDFSALENVMIPMLIAGKNKSEARHLGELLLEQVGLSDREHHQPRQLSGGEQQRVAVARALANEPEIVLADEPSGNLDTVTGRKLHDLLFELNDKNDVTFLIATHNQELAQRCFRHLKIVNGAISDHI